jgi:hypothetical protein
LSYESNRNLPPPVFNAASRKRIDEKDASAAANSLFKLSSQTMRAESLRMLHEEKVATFVGRPGMGLARMEPAGPSYLPRRQP